MAQHLNPNINPSDVIIENISSYSKQTSDVMDEIENNDFNNLNNQITFYQNEIDNLLNYKKYTLQQRHFKGTIEQRNSITNPIAQSIFFIKES